MAARLCCSPGSIDDFREHLEATYLTSFEQAAAVQSEALGASVAHHVSRRRLELCFATYLIMVCGQFGSSLALA